MSSQNSEFIIRVIDSINDPLWPQWKSLYYESFPENERMSEDYFVGVLQQKAAGGAPNLHILALVSTEEPDILIGMGYDEFAPECSAVFLWYIATQPEQRGQGVGAKLYAEILQRAKEEGAKAMFFEVEIPDESSESKDGARMAQRRIAWYKRQGALLMNGIQYFQGLDVPVDPIEMHIMVHIMVHMDVEQIFATALDLFKEDIKQVGAVSLG